MITEEQLTELKNGDLIKEYSIFSNLSFVSVNKKSVRMRDAAGNEKEVYKSLFLKYAKL